MLCILKNSKHLFVQKPLSTPFRAMLIDITIKTKGPMAYFISCFKTLGNLFNLSL